VRIRFCYAALLSALIGSAALAGCGGSQPPMPALAPQQSSLSSLSSLPAAKATQSWPQYGYDPGHSGFNPLDTAITKKNVAQLKLAWSRSTIIQPTGIVTSGKTLYVADGNQPAGAVYALDASTGKIAWNAKVGLNGGWGSFAAVPAVSGNVVVTPCGNKLTGASLKTGICGLNAKSGKRLWSQLCKAGYCGISTSPAVYNGLAYYQFSDNYFTEYTAAVHPDTGKVAWTVPGASDCKDAGQGGDLPLPAANGYVFAPFACAGAKQDVTEVCALSAATGATAWCRPLSTQYITSLFESGKQLFATDSGSAGNYLVALDQSNGKVQWSKSLVNTASDVFAVASGRVFISLHNGNGLYAFDAATGKQLWVQTSNIGGGISVANGVVYTDANPAIVALDEKTGAVVWTSSQGNGSTPATPVLVNGTIYAGCYTMCAFTLPKK
jgi:outer membrane protein assembly factor BamB